MSATKKEIVIGVTCGEWLLEPYLAREGRAVLIQRGERGYDAHPLQVLLPSARDLRDALNLWIEDEEKSA